MKRTFRKFFKFGNTKTMIAGGFGKRGPYAFIGAKDKSGISIGTSIGINERNVYASYNKNKGQIRAKYNIESQKITPRLRKPLRLLRKK